MLFTVSTVKDSRGNVEQFVTRNLAAGADHMFVFLEGNDDDTYGYLHEHPFVTPVITDDDYWVGQRPDELTRRQIVNANLVNCLVSPFELVEWLVHLDGDECLDIDRDELLGLGAETRCVRLEVLEAVSTENGTRDVKYFKKKLDRPQLEMLTRSGVIEAPDNRAYFSGYVKGKAAVRPGLDLDMGIHRALMKNGAAIEHLEEPKSRVLHYESVSADEFVRKWVSHLSGGATLLRERRRVVASDVAAVLADETADQVTKSARLLELYRRHVEDPVDLLREHNLLVELGMDRHRHQPIPFPDALEQARRDLLNRLLRVDKSRLRAQGRPDSAIELMREIRDELGGRQRPTAERIDAAIDRALPGLSDRAAIHGPGGDGAP